MIGIANTAVDRGLKINILKGTLVNSNMAPISPQADSHRGTSFD
jgi:hypothetical protein